MDHIGSLAELKRTYPAMEIIAHELEKPYIDGTNKSLRLEQAESTLDTLSNEAKLPWRLISRRCEAGSAGTCSGV